MDVLIIQELQHVDIVLLAVMVIPDGAMKKDT